MTTQESINRPESDTTDAGLKKVLELAASLDIEDNKAIQLWKSCARMQSAEGIGYYWFEISVSLGRPIRFELSDEGNITASSPHRKANNPAQLDPLIDRYGPLMREIAELKK